jgi:polyphosphate kinase
VRLIIRGMFTLSPGLSGISENIQAIRLVDKYLEHSRIMFFANGGNEKCYITSGDWMPRNLDRRIEVACPILDKNLRKELRDVLELQWQDNVKASQFGIDGRTNGATRSGRRRAQLEIHSYLAKLNS